MKKAKVLSILLAAIMILLHLYNCVYRIVIRNVGNAIALIYGVVLHYSHILAAIDVVNNRILARGVAVVGGVVVGATLRCILTSIHHRACNCIERRVCRYNIHIAR